jgi:hypothetical protein
VAQPIAVPYAPTLPYLRQQASDVNQIDGVRVAALMGIHRHVESQWFLSNQRPADDVINGLTQEMLAIVTETEPPAGRSPEAHAWIRGRAVDILGSLSGWLPSPATVTALSDIMADADAPVGLRCRAAYALGRIDYNQLGGAGTDLAALAGNVAGLLADACKIEVTRLEQEKTELTSQRGTAPGGVGGFGEFTGPNPSSAMGGGSGMGMGMGMGDEDSGGGFPFSGSGMGMGGYPGGSRGSEDDDGADTGGLPKHIVDGSRRRLLYEVACVRTGVAGPATDSTFKGLKALAANDPTADATIRDIEEAIQALDEAVNKKDYVLNDLLKNVRIQMQNLDRLRPQDKIDAAATSDIPDVPTEDVPGDVPSEDLPGEGIPSGDVPSESADPADSVPPADLPPDSEPSDVPPADEGDVPG